MSILAIDYGGSHLGLAFSPDGRVSYQLSSASGGPVISYRSEREVFDRLEKICREKNIDKIVIGLPLDQNGNLSPQAEKAKKFGEKLARWSGLRVSYWNETLTSTEAKKSMIAAGVPKEKRKKLEHSFAAQIVLQEFLDAK
ncbi:MAG: Holliday junction resolvase RuvX [Candidatus Cloacimonetes bacterium]|nr:Holliday junction resolvase RuvX [Candidatus Cloacimonadota bacterium]